VFWNLVKKTVINIFNGGSPMNEKKKHRKPIRLFVFATGHDERIPKEPPDMEVKLSKALKPGFRRAFTVGMDEPVDKQADGSYAKSEVVEGDSRAAEILPESTAKLLTGWIYGDGAIGTKKDRITVDGHVGDGDVPITLDITYDVASPDATEFVDFKEGAEEAIPV
jgi:hypothetical protein